MKKILLLITLLFMHSSFAEVKVKNLNLTKSNGKATLQVSYEGILSADPVVTVRNNNIVQIALKDGVVWPKMESKVNLLKRSARKDTTLMAYQFSKVLARVRAILPFKIKENNLDIRLKDHKILVSFPMIKSERKALVHNVLKKAVKVKSKEKYDESFLDALIAENDQGKQAPKKISTSLSKLKKQTSSTKSIEDKVDTKLSGVDKSLDLKSEKKSSFSIISYFGKFVVFLGVILLFFYGVVTLMKKGVLKKGKLGFLNNTSVITVLNTTYVGPKRSLMLVKVHQQTFLISSTEKGIEFLSEVNDTAGLLREGERDVSGSNFDTALTDDSVEDAPIKLKEDITKSQPIEQNSGILTALKKTQNKDQVRFSDQIKSKVRNLKPLQ